MTSQTGMIYLSRRYAAEGILYRMRCEKSKIVSAPLVGLNRDEKKE